MNSDRAQIFEVNETNFDLEVLKSKQPVVVAFLALWSRPCHIIGEVLDEVAAACAGRAKFVKVNVDDNLDLGIWYEIQSIPTLLCFVNGKAGVRIVGTASKEAILTKLNPFITA
jgi:thioredoxin 1